MIRELFEAIGYYRLAADFDVLLGNLAAHAAAYAAGQNDGDVFHNWLLLAYLKRLYIARKVVSGQKRA